MNIKLCSIALLATSCISLPAQVAHTVTLPPGLAASTATGHRYSLPSGAFPFGTYQTGGTYAMPTTSSNAVCIGSTSCQEGGIAVNQNDGSVWTAINSIFGSFLNAESHPDYPGITGSSILTPMLPDETVIVGLEIDSGNDSGLNPTGGEVLFVLDSNWTIYFLALPTTFSPPPLVSPAPMTLMSSFTIPNQDAEPAGIAYNRINAMPGGLLYVTDTTGSITLVDFANTFATPLGPAPAPGLSITGIALNTSNLGPSYFTCAGQPIAINPPFTICLITASGDIIDYENPALTITAPGLGAGATLGLSISSDAQVLSSTSNPISLSLSSPFVEGLPTQSLLVSGLPTSGTGVLAVDLCPGLITAPFGQLFIDPASPTFISVPFPLNGTGSDSLMFTNDPSLVGAQATFQVGAFPTSGSPTLSNGLTMMYSYR